MFVFVLLRPHIGFKGRGQKGEDLPEGRVGRAQAVEQLGAKPTQRRGAGAARGGSVTFKIRPRGSYRKSVQFLILEP